jgi:hypothetical protein
MMDEVDKSRLVALEAISEQAQKVLDRVRILSFIELEVSNLKASMRILQNMLDDELLRRLQS